MEFTRCTNGELTLLDINGHFALPLLGRPHGILNLHYLEKETTPE
jgi:hypothetical protein